MSDTNRGTKRQAPTESSNLSETNENLSQDEILSLPGTSVFDETFSQVSKGKRRRKRFNTSRRKEVAKVRKIGACEECRARKVACKHALQATENLDSAPTPRPSSPPYPFDFEAAYSNPIYPRTILEDGVGQMPQLDGSQSQDLLSDEGSYLIATGKGLTRRQARLKDEMHDFDNVIADNSGRSRFKSDLVPAQWGQNSLWMVSAVALTNSQQSPQPSTEYLYSNVSTNPGLSSSTPASSDTDLVFTGTSDVPYCSCNKYTCDHSHTYVQQQTLMISPENAYVEPRSPTGDYPCPMECGMNSFKLFEKLQTHINLIHPDYLSGPTHLLPMSDSKLGAQPNRLAHVEKFLAEEYAPGLEENPIAVIDQRAPRSTDHLSVENWVSQGIPSKAQNLRRSNPPLQRQLSMSIVDGVANAFEIQSANAHYSVGNNIMSSSPYSSFQQTPLHSQNSMGEINGLNEQYRKRYSQPPPMNSPTPSWSSQLAQDLQTSDQTNVYRGSNDIGEVFMSAGLQPDNHGTFTTIGNASPIVFPNFNTNWSPSASDFSPQNINSHSNVRYAQTDVNFRPGNNGSNMGMTSWSGPGSSLRLALIKGNNADYMPASFQPVNQGTECLSNDGSIQQSCPPSSAKQPTIVLNSQKMLHGGPNSNFDLALNTLSSDPISQQHGVPYLDHGTLSSSGASESLVSPVDAANPFSNKSGENWDIASNFFNDFGNMDVNTNDDTT